MNFLANAVVGQKVYVTPAYRWSKAKNHYAQVTKVGRKLVTMKILNANH